MKNITNKPPRFFSSYSIFVEGKDDLEFIVAFLRKIKLDDKIYVHEIGGDGQLFNKMKDVIKEKEFEKNVRKLLIFFDSDNNQEKKFKDICKKLTEINKLENNVELLLPKKFNKINSSEDKKSVKAFHIPVSICFFHENLETVYLNTLDDKNMIKILEKCIPEFFNCCDSKKSNEIKSKAKVMAFIASSINKSNDLEGVKDIASLSKRTADSKSTKSGLINFDHKTLKAIKEFLIEFYKS